MENNTKKGIFSRFYTWLTNLTVKGLLGAIFIAFIVIIILLSISQLPGVFSRISSSLSAALYSVFVPVENATMTVDNKIVNSGEDFNINFKRGDVTDGLFTISYACNSDIDLLSVESSGLKRIDCETPYYLLESENSIKIRPVATESVVRLNIEGAFENNQTQKIDKVGVVRVTVTNDTAGTIVNPPVENTPVVTTPTTPTTPTYVPAPTPIQPVYYGKPDLAIRVLQVGLLSGTNYITTRSQFNYQDMVGIKFEVRNDGDANTGLWSFTASLPSVSTPTYSSNTQISLRPGESIIFTLGFSNLSNQSTGLITINVDPQNIVSESLEYNNIITSTITNLSYNTNYYNNNTNGCYVNGVFTYNCLNYNNNYYNNNYNTNGCYVNGIFTYNCLNYNNNDWNYGYNTLGVNCYAEPSDPETGDRVRWYANAFGGDGDYDYEWDGTNGLDSSSKNPSKTYTSRGWKYATVTVESDGYSISQTCSVYVD